MRVMGYDVKYSHVLATGAPAGCTGQPQTAALWWAGQCTEKLITVECRRNSLPPPACLPALQRWRWGLAPTPMNHWCLQRRERHHCGVRWLAAPTSNL